MRSLTTLLLPSSLLTAVLTAGCGGEQAGPTAPAAPSFLNVGTTYHYVLTCNKFTSSGSNVILSQETGFFLQMFCGQDTQFSGVTDINYDIFLHGSDGLPVGPVCRGSVTSPGTFKCRYRKWVATLTVTAL